MLDWEGNMQPKRDHQHWIILDDVEDDVNMVASLQITQLEQEVIDAHLVEDDKHYDGMRTMTIPMSADNVSSTLGSISNTLVDQDLSWYMCEKEQDGWIAASIGSTNTLASRYISDSEPEDDEPYDNNSTCKDDDMSFDLSFDLDSDGAQEKVEEFFSHVTNASRPHGVTLEHLSKIWGISPEDTRRTIDTTTQTSVRTQDPTLSRNYGTGDCMLRYQCIQDYFFMDTFFATKKGG